jgi:ribosomal protein L16/L10AE
MTARLENVKDAETRGQPDGGDWLACGMGKVVGIEREGAGMTRANRAEMSWDGEKHGWVVRVIVGEEVIKRRCGDVTQAATEEALRAAALKVAADEGFDLDPDAVAIRK